MTMEGVADSLLTRRPSCQRLRCSTIPNLFAVREEVQEWVQGRSPCTLHTSQPR
jgi:hypothetical protein